LHRIKVGIVNYLNTKPLIYGLSLPKMEKEIELVGGYPAEISEWLSSDKIDIGLVPVATLPALGKYNIVSDFCISAEKESASVCLFSQRPLQEIKKIFLDYQSNTSNQLLTWLVKTHWRLQVEFIQSDNDGYIADIDKDVAGLVIGDRALRERKNFAYTYDLATAWRVATGLPFVFACWASKKVFAPHFLKTFNEANEMGMNKIAEIAEAQHFSFYDLNKYFTENISYKLTDKKRESIAFFLKNTAEIQL